MGFRNLLGYCFGAIKAITKSESNSSLESKVIEIKDPEQIKAAAKWWTNHLRDEFRNHTGVQKINEFANTRNACTLALKPAQIGDFERYLTDSITENYKAWRSCKEDLDASYVLGTDYHPEKIFSDAAEKAGFNITDRLPLKTMMWIYLYKPEVRVRPGYRADEKRIYPSEN